MPHPALRPLASAAVAGGLCWIAFAVSSVLSAAEKSNEKVDLSGTGDYLGFGLFAVCLALAVTAVVALHLHHRGADGRLGRVGAIAAGAAAQCVVISGIVVNGEETSWFGIAAPLAILTWFAGSVVLGVAVHRAGLLPRWVGIALPIVTAFAIVGSDAGTSALIGVFQIVVGWRIVRAAGAGAEHSVSGRRTARRVPAQPA